MNKIIFVIIIISLFYILHICNIIINFHSVKQTDILQVEEYNLVEALLTIYVENIYEFAA